MKFETFVGSIEGPYHRKNSIPNQDVPFWHEDRDWFVAAVADGAGSLKYSDIGAYDAASAAVEAITKAYATTEFENLSAIGIEAGRKAQMANPNYKEYGSTLTLIVLKHSGEWTAGSVGDSFGVIHYETGAHELITGTPLGEFANITELLTSATIHPIYTSGSGSLGFSLSSDGLENVALSKGKAHPGFWNGIRDKAVKGGFQVHELFNWLESLDRIVDDTTLLTVVKR